MSACYHFVVLYIQMVEISSEFKNYVTSRVYKEYVLVT